MDLLRGGAAPLTVLTLVLAVASGSTACAHSEESGASRGAPARTAAADRGERTEEGGGAGSTEAERREISTDRAFASDPGAGTPEREASLKVVEEGKGYLIARRPSEAARRFQQATRIDPTNGFAWYYLGRARIETGSPSSAAGVLEKAEALLGPYPEWRDRAAALSASLGGR